VSSDRRKRIKFWLLIWRFETRILPRLFVPFRKPPVRLGLCFI